MGGSSLATSGVGSSTQAGGGSRSGSAALPRLQQLSNAAAGIYRNHPLLLYYRRDVFEQGLPQQGLPGGTLIPQTWDELLALAQRLNGTVDLNGDGKKDYALCLDSVQSQCGGG